MRERAERAEHREEVHQTHWAKKLDRLRIETQGLGPLGHPGRMAGEGIDLLRHQLHAAEQRSTVLEERLIQLMQETGQGSSRPSVVTEPVRYKPLHC